jgi:hypothetical protein
MIDTEGYGHTHARARSEYVTPIAFPRQQWLLECATMLRLYVHCLSLCIIVYLTVYRPVITIRT